MNLSFAELFTQLDQTTKTNVKIEAMARYFAQADPSSAAWAIYFLTGRRLKRLVSTRLLRNWAAEASALPIWLFDECYQTVGDLAETMARVIPSVNSLPSKDLYALVTEDLLPLRHLEESEARSRILHIWKTSRYEQKFLINKLMTGGLRVGVSQKLVLRSLAKHSGLDVEVLSHRMMGNWEPTSDWFGSLLDAEIGETMISRPYPFLLAHPLDRPVSTIGPLNDWLLEWKWDGIRAQIVKREGVSFIWSRGEELMEGRFPELDPALEQISDGTVLDGELLGWQAGRPLPFSQLQKRINRKRVTTRLLKECPVRFFAFDLLEKEGDDFRETPLAERRQHLVEVVGSQSGPDTVVVSPEVSASDWGEVEMLRNRAREQGVEGLMLKPRDSRYGVGRIRNSWWKWKVDALTIDAVLIYAQRGHGRRASLYTDYTFAVWHEEQLVPFAKAYSGLNDKEIRSVDQFIRRNIREKFGPVRSVTPELVFEIAFEGISRSPRHKSGIAVRFPRILRWRQDKRAEDANSLNDLQDLLSQIELHPETQSP